MPHDSALPGLWLADRLGRIPRSYRGSQLFGANAVDVFHAYHQACPQAPTARANRALIDQLIHAFHISIAAN